MNNSEMRAIKDALREEKQQQHKIWSNLSPNFNVHFLEAY